MELIALPLPLVCNALGPLIIVVGALRPRDPLARLAG